MECFDGSSNETSDFGKEKKRRQLSPPSHVIFSKALMEATGRHQPKGCDLEDMYAFLPGQLATESTAELPEKPEKPEKAETKIAWTGSRRRDLSLPTQSPAHKTKGTCARARANSRNKGLVWKPKLSSLQNEGARVERADPSRFRCGGS